MLHFTCFDHVGDNPQKMKTVLRIWQNHYTNRNENQSNKEEEDLKGEKLGGWRGRLLATNLDRERVGAAHYDDRDDDDCENDDRDNHDRAAAAHYDDRDDDGVQAPAHEG